MNDIEQFQEFHRYLTLLETMGYRYDPVNSDSKKIAFRIGVDEVKYFNSVCEMKGYVDGYESRGQQMRVGIGDIKKIITRDTNRLLHINGDLFPGNVSVEDETYETLCQTLADGLNCPF
jgi:hypothetical protein